MGKGFSTEQFQNRLDEINGIAEYSVADNYQGAKKPVSIKHKCGWIIKDINGSYPLNNKLLCPICDKSSRFMTTEAFAYRLYLKFGDEYTLLSEFNGMMNDVTVLHNKCGKSFTVNAFWLLNKAIVGCKECADDIQRITNEEFVERIIAINPNIVLLSEYYNSKTDIQCQCKICGYKWDSKGNSLLSGRGCPVCSNNVVLKGYNDLWTTMPKVAENLKSQNDGYIYSKCSNKSVDFKCIRCGYEINKKIELSYNKDGEYICPCCGDGISYPEKFMHNFLQQLGVEYISQLSCKDAKWCNTYRYDFYIPSISTIIEMHGAQHYIGFNGDFELKTIQQNDKSKKQLALHNNISNYIEINSSESSVSFIKEHILSSIIPKLFDISNINWIQCGKFASSSFLLSACDKWNNGNTIGEIASELSVSIPTVNRYLIRGTELNLCDFSKSLSFSRSHIKANKTKLYPVRNKRTGVIYPSCYEANVALGKKRNAKTISRCCRGVIKTAWGDEWEYA